MYVEAMHVGAMHVGVMSYGIDVSVFCHGYGHMNILYSAGDFFSLDISASILGGVPTECTIPYIFDNTSV